MKNKMTKLLPCPFCGGEAQTEFMAHESPAIACSGINCAVIIPGNTEKDAIKNWNKRTTLAAAKKRIKKARKALWAAYGK